MTTRTLLACLLDEASAPMLSRAAARIAVQQDAHLIGQHTLEAIIIYPGIAMHMDGEVYAAFHDKEAKTSEAIEAIFRKAAEAEGCLSEWRSVDAGTGLPADRMIESARACDMVIVGRPSRDETRSEQRFAIDQVIRGSGRPVLVIPDKGLGETLGKRAMIAHAGTRESARAAFDLLPLLAPGAEVHVVHVGDEKDELRDWSMTELCAAIARHGHKVTMAHRPHRGRSVADTLIEVASEIGADVIASGAYGHSRTYAFFLGATTGGLLRDAPVPVLFSG